MSLINQLHVARLISFAVQKHCHINVSLLGGRFHFSARTIRAMQKHWRLSENDFLHGFHGRG